jgi:hypothetical protein
MSFEKDTESSEIIYSRLKREIEKTSKEIETSINKIFGKEEVTKAKKLIDFFNQNSKWVHSTFKTEISNNKVEYPILTNPEWIEENNQKINSELGDKIYLCKDEINYTICNNEIRAIVNLKNESSFWIFLRTKEIFSKENAVIYFKKEELSQNVHISLGNFYLNSNNKLIFKTFIKQQLIMSMTNEKNENSDFYKNRDIVKLNIKICDKGDEIISVYTNVNDNKEDNLVKGSFFIPISDNYKLMIAGIGECKLSKFSCDLNYKTEYAPPEFSNDIKGCNCCNIL